MDQTTPYVFISYASTDRARALELARSLEAVGVAVWIDRASIVGGTSWSAEIVRGIQGCAALLLLSSPEAMASKNVRQEVQLAFEADRPLLPLILRPAEPPAEVVYALAGRQWISMLEQPDDAWLPLLLTALQRLGFEPAPTRSAPTADEPETTVGTAHRESATSGLTNLPVPLTEFIGRAAEVAEVAGLLKSQRLVTVTGPGGTGKTRLAIEVAGQVMEDYADGVYFVALESISDPQLVLTAIARTLEIALSGAQPPADALGIALRQRHMLLILDNFEQILGAAPEVAQLLRNCPQLTVLISSRAPLHVYGEREYPLLPLPLPAAIDDAALDRVQQSAAVRLFCSSARAVRPGFQLTLANARVVAEICSRLDGLPLALELAAARIKMLSPELLLSRLEARLPLLTTGARDLPARQRTLRDAIAWSHDLLTPEEQSIFRRLAIFVGGFTFEAAEAVCTSPGERQDGTLELLSSLVDRSLVQIGIDADGEQRLKLLETVREFGMEELASSGERPAIQESHLQFFRGFVRLYADGSQGPDSLRWHELMEADLPNVRSAMEYAVETGQVEQALDLFGQLGRFWRARGHSEEGERWSGLLLAQPSSSALVRARALATAAAIAWYRRGPDATLAYLTEAVDLFRSSGGDDPWMGMALAFLSSCTGVMGREDALSYAEEAVRISLRPGRAWFLGWAEHYRGWVLRLRRDVLGAHSSLAASIRAFRESGDIASSAWSLHQLGGLAIDAGEIQVAVDHLTEAAALLRVQKDRQTERSSLLELAVVAALQGDADKTVECFHQVQRVSSSFGATSLGVADALSISRHLHARGSAGLAVQAVSAAGTLLARRRVASHDPVLDSIRRLSIQPLQDVLSPTAFEEAWEQGSDGDIDACLLRVLRATADAVRADQATI